MYCSVYQGLKKFHPCVLSCLCIVIPVLKSHLLYCFVTCFFPVILFKIMAMHVEVANAVCPPFWEYILHLVLLLFRVILYTVYTGDVSRVFLTKTSFCLTTFWTHENIHSHYLAESTVGLGCRNFPLPPKVVRV